MKQSIWITAAIGLAVICSGCMDQRELSELGVIGAAAYDAQDGGTKVMLDVLQQDSDGAQILTGDGPGCQEAIEAANEKLDRQVYTSHIRVHLLGEDYARRDVAELADMTLRDQAFRIDVPMVVTRDVEASEVLQAAAEKGGMESENLYRLVHENAQLGRSVETSVLEFAKQSRDKNTHPLVGCVTVEQSPQGNKELSCSGAAVFSGYQLIGYLDEDQTLACQLVRGKPVHTSLYLNQSGSSVQIDRKRTKIYVDEQAAKVKITLDVSVTGKTNTMDTEALLEETRREVQEIVQRTIEEVQRNFGLDLFDFSRTMKKKGISSDTWDTNFSQMPVSVEVETILKSAGQLAS